MTKPPYNPDRGHFVYLSFTPQAGTEQAGRRPALVLSPLAFNIGTGLAIVCPITNQMKGGPMEVPIPAGKVTGVALVDHVRSVDWMARRAEFIDTAPIQVTDDVVARLAAIIGLT